MVSLEEVPTCHMSRSHLVFFIKMGKQKEETDLKLLPDDAQREEEEEEALSLSDLPVELEQREKPCTEEAESESESEFEFGIGLGSWLGSLSTQPLPEMCAADDLFFQGRILPLRCHDSAVHSTVGSVSRSDSMGSGWISRVTSTSSRSSSKGSQQSWTSTSCGSSRVTYSSVSNRFGSCPSPSPQNGFPGNNKHVRLQGTKTRSKSQRNSYSSSSSSSMWEFFRPGLVRTPEIELHSLKPRAKNSICDDNNREEQRSKNKKGIGFGLLGGCKCTADSVATNLVLLRSDSRRIGSRRKSHEGSMEVRRKLMELIEIDDGRTVMENHRRDGHTSRRLRTFEWVKELPHAGSYYVLHQSLDS